MAAGGVSVHDGRSVTYTLRGVDLSDDIEPLVSEEDARQLRELKQRTYHPNHAVRRRARRQLEALRKRLTT